MLRSLHIRNLAIIEELEFEFSAGFSVLTGETGAGKSILIDALGLVTGARADSGLVRAGTERAEVTAEFTIMDSPGAKGWLAEHEMEDEDRCLIRRVVQADGRTRAFVNGSAIAVGELRGLGEMLVAVYGQGESQTLLRTETQRQVIDAFGGHTAALEVVGAGAREIAAIDAEIRALQAMQTQDPSQLEFLRFQLQELDALDLGAGENELLDAEHRRLSNAGRLITDGAAAQAALYGGEDSVYDRMSALVNVIRALIPLHEGFSEAESLAANAQSLARDAADAIRRELDHLELDPERLAEVETRLGAVHSQARKHRVRADALHERHLQLRDELARLENASVQLQALERHRTAAVLRYRSAAAVLGTARGESGGRLASMATELVRQLGMPNAQFEVVVEPIDPAPRPSPHGDDAVRFDFSANPGQPPRALSRVASGGELSRVSLAIQVCVQKSGQAAGDAASTMVFDEVDAGIGGGVAEIVGRQLRALGKGRQVMCVTHLAQVAAQGEKHFGIRKEVETGSTFTRIEDLGAKARADELARMIGGTDITSATLALARDLLKRVP